MGEAGSSTPPGCGARRAAAVLERLAQLPGAEQVLQLAAGRDDVELVGGAVRDLLLGGVPREIDIALDGERASFPHEAVLFARELAQRLDGPCQVSFHERFATAALRWRGGRIDIAARRAETYPEPGALPQVRPGTGGDDLARRDFTVNALAVGIGGERLGRLRAAAGALADLDGGVLRVLHDRSFLDDPTRLMRLARYAARLGFAVEPHTARLAARALAAGAMRTLSPARVGAELRLAAAEGDPVAAMAQLQELGVLAAIEERLTLDESTARAALALLPADGRPDLLVTAALAPALCPGDELQSLLQRWEYPVADRRVLLEVASRSARLAQEISRPMAPSQLRRLLAGLTPETIALAGALGSRGGAPAAAQTAQRWLSVLRHVRLRITGEDLLAAGLAQGPEIGERLERVLSLRLDGKIGDGRQAELRAAMGDRS